jgi:stalled ribosome rescue protein Dom34
MKSQAGVWIDHKQAFVVLVGDGPEESRRIESGVESSVRFSGGNRPEDGLTDDQRDRKHAAHLDTYYDEVIACVHDSGAILIMGPGEAKGEFGKRLAGKGPGPKVVGVETVDKMTAAQIAAKVRQRFGKQG